MKNRPPKANIRTATQTAALALIALLAAPPPAQTQNEAQPTPDETKQTYDQLCAGCHGLDARGTQQGPGLAGNPTVRRRSAESLRRVITRGIPAAGMPPFDLPGPTLNALVALVESLNAAAADTPVPGDPTAGQAYFFGQGNCATCHMIQGQGSPLGPDLSEVAKTNTVDELTQSLEDPSAKITPGYQLVSIELNNGTKQRGFERNRTRYHVILQDLKGQFHPHALEQVTQIQKEDNSLMPAAKATAEQKQNLLAYLSRRTGIQPHHPNQTPTETRGAGMLPAQQETKTKTQNQQSIPWKRILGPDPQDWLTYNGNLSGNRYSQLTQINKQNVHQLTLKWTHTIPLWQQFLPDTPYFHENMRYFGLETVPLVADGIMYLTGPNQIYALDAKSGTAIWHYQRPRTEGLVSDPSLGTNRGVALLNDNVYMVTDDARLIALNRITGRLVWETVMPHEPQRYGGTVAPLIVKDMVIAGVAGGDWGIRGFLDAYDAQTGTRRWRHWTIPAPGEPGSETWQGTAIHLGGGSTWLTGSYDPQTDTLYWGTGNPYPNSDDSQRGGDNLYTDSVLALDPDTGERKWYYQFTPHDTHDWDAAVPNVLIDTEYRGQPRKLLLNANRNGFFYVFDRTGGERLLSESFMHKLTWASGIGEDGRPQRLPPGPLSCPDHATNWNGTAYSPKTKLYYVMASEKCTVSLQPGTWKNPRPPEDPGQKYLRALNIETGQIAWEVEQAGPIGGKRMAGILGTAAGLLFYGDPSGYFVAADEENGKTLWKLPLNATIKTSPMTYAVDGEQFVTLAVGANILTFGLEQ